MVSRLQLLKYIGFVVGLAAKFVTGSIFVFNVYQDAIKSNFNYTQTEGETSEDYEKSGDNAPTFPTLSQFTDSIYMVAL